MLQKHTSLCNLKRFEIISRDSRFGMLVVISCFRSAFKPVVFPCSCFIAVLVLLHTLKSIQAKSSRSVRIQASFCFVVVVVFFAVVVCDFWSFKRRSNFRALFVTVFSQVRRRFIAYLLRNIFPYYSNRKKLTAEIRLVHERNYRYGQCEIFTSELWARQDTSVSECFSRRV